MFLMVKNEFKQASAFDEWSMAYIEGDIVPANDNEEEK